MKTFIAIAAIVLSIPAGAATVCSDISTFPTVTRNINGKEYKLPKCVIECLSVTPYTNPRCVDYDNVLVLRPAKTASNADKVKRVEVTPSDVVSGPLSVVTPAAGPISCLDKTTLPTVTRDGVTYPVCVKQCGVTTSTPFVATLTNGNAVAAVADTANLAVGGIVTGAGVAANTKIVSKTDTSITLSIPATFTGSNMALSYVVPAIRPPVCVSFVDVQ